MLLLGHRLYRADKSITKLIKIKAVKMPIAASQIAMILFLP
jgi:hypothetical protein